MDYFVLTFCGLFTVFGIVSVAAGLLILRLPLSDRVRTRWRKQLTRERILSSAYTPPDDAADELIASRRQLNAIAAIGIGASLIVFYLLGLILIRILYGRIVGDDDTAALVLIVLLYISLYAAIIAGCSIPRLAPFRFPGVPRGLLRVLVLPNAVLWLLVFAVTVGMLSGRIATHAEQVDTRLALSGHLWLFWISPITAAVLAPAQLWLWRRVTSSAPRFTSDEQLDYRSRHHWQARAICWTIAINLSISSLAAQQARLLDLTDDRLSLLLTLTGDVCAVLYPCLAWWLWRRLRLT